MWIGKRKFEFVHGLVTFFWISSYECMGGAIRMASRRESVYFMIESIVSDIQLT